MINNQIISHKSREYNHIEPGDERNTKSYRICGALTRNELTRNEYCQHSAGQGTDHPGEGRCYLHGGRQPVGPLSASWKGGTSGRYKIPANLMKYYPIDKDRNPLDLSQELDVQTLVINLALSRLAGRPFKPPARRNGNDANRSNNHDVGSIGNDVGRVDGSDMVGDGGGGDFRVLEPSGDIPPVEFLPVGNQNASNVLTDEQKALLGSVGIEYPEIPSGKEFIVREEDIVLLDKLIQSAVATKKRMNDMRIDNAMSRMDVLYMSGILKEAIKMFVEKDKQAPMVRYLIDRIPLMSGEASEEGEEK